MEDPLNRAPDCTSDPRAKPEASRESSAMLLYEVVNAALHALQVNADDTKARNYVEVAFVGLAIPFDRAAVTLVRPGGKTPHELMFEAQAARVLLQTRVAELEKIVADTSCHPGSAAIIAESHRYVLRARGMDLPEDLIDELARNAAHVLALTAEANEAEAEGAG